MLPKVSGPSLPGPAKRRSPLTKELARLRKRIAGLNASKQEVEKLYENLKHRTCELETRNRELETFCCSVSHDLRNPLIGIKGFSSLLVQKYSHLLDEKGLRFLSLIQKETQNMLHLIENLFEFFHLEHREIEQSEIDMGELANEVCEELKNIKPVQRLNLKMETLPPARGDRGMIRQVFFNLFSNAFKFTKPGRSVMIEVGGHTRKNVNTYYVKDNGVGFDMRHAQKLFNLFQRLHDREEFEGTGVGLALVQRIVQRHGGSVWAEGRVDEGATFYFTLLTNTEQVPKKSMAAAGKRLPEASVKREEIGNFQ